MRQASKRVPDSAEKTVRDIRRAQKSLTTAWSGNVQATCAVSFIVKGPRFRHSGQHQKNCRNLIRRSRYQALVVGLTLCGGP